MFQKHTCAKWKDERENMSKDLLNVDYRRENRRNVQLVCQQCNMAECFMIVVAFFVWLIVMDWYATTMDGMMMKTMTKERKFLQQQKMHHEYSWIDSFFLSWSRWTDWLLYMSLYRTSFFFSFGFWRWLPDASFVVRD